MDKQRAFTEIEKILYSKEHSNKSFQEHKTMIEEVLNKLQSYNYSLGKRHGMFKAVNILTEQAEKEGNDTN